MPPSTRRTVAHGQASPLTRSSMMELGPIGPLSRWQVEHTLHAANAAPSKRNSQPWQIACGADGFDLCADFDRTSPGADSQREALLACGAAWFNLTLTIRSLGMSVTTRLLPDPASPHLVARVFPGSFRGSSREDEALASAVPLRHTSTQPLAAVPLSDSFVHALGRAARREGAWLAPLTPNQVRVFHHLENDASRDPATDSMSIAVPRQDDGAAVQTPTGESEPLRLVVGTLSDDGESRVRAGAAMQRVLLMATSSGLATSFTSQIVTAPRTRSALREVTGGALWGQTIVILGRAIPGIPTARRPLEEFVTWRSG